MSAFPVVKDALLNPPIPFEPEKQTLKAWAMYCLRSRGFIVVYAQNADFAIEPRAGDKLYFKVTTPPSDNLDNSVNWITWDSATRTINVIPSQETAGT